MGLAKLSTKCRSCPFLDICSNKEMEQVGCFKDPIAANAGESTAIGVAAPVLRETIDIYIDGNALTVYVDNIKKALCEELFSGLITPGRF